MKKRGMFEIDVLTLMIISLIAFGVVLFSYLIISGNLSEWIKYISDTLRLRRFS